ncbi:MAG: hypothetical protein R2939_02245 [Kofleriaceae bacterium]
MTTRSEGRPRWRPAVVVATVILMIAGSTGARADASRDDAERLFRAGAQAYKAAQYETATRAFEEAFALLPLPAITFSEAQAYRLWYVASKEPAYLRRAVELYQRYVADQREGELVADAIGHLADLEPVLAAWARPARRRRCPRARPAPS